jgi:hypothetical protein
MPNSDVVFVVRERVARPELQYALRSLRFIDHNTVWLIGGKPDWVQNVEHVPFKDSDKWRNISDKFKSLATLEGLSEEFIYTEDDYYILRPHDRLPNLSRPRSLNAYVESRIRRKPPPNEWTLYLKNTRDALHAAGITDPVSFDVHVPMYIHKSQIPLHWDPGVPVSWRSMCGNFDGRDHRPIATDVKVRSRKKLRLARATGFLSSKETSFRRSGIDRYLAALLPDFSPYEKESTR